MALEKGKQESSEQEGTGANVTLSPADLQALIAKTVEQTKEEVLKSVQGGTSTGGNSDMKAFASELAKAINGSGSKTVDDYYSEDYLDVETIDQDDILEKSVVFYYPGLMTVIVDDKRNGNNIGIPKNCGVSRKEGIEFKYYTTKKVLEGKHTVLYRLSKYVCESKTLLDWLRNHSGYNLWFFEKAASAMSADLQKVHLVVKYSKQLDGLSFSALNKMAQDNQIPHYEDTRDTKIALAQKFANIEFGKVVDSNSQAIKDTYLEKKAIDLVD